GEYHERGARRGGGGEEHHLLLPAAEVEPWPAQELADFGKHRERLRLGIDAARGAARGLVGEPAADHEVFGHRQLRKDAGILGRIADAALGALVRREVGGVLSAEANLTRTQWEEAGDALDDGGAPGAVAPDQRDDLTVVDAQRYAAQDVRRSAKGIYGLDLEQHLLVLRDLRPIAARREGCWRRPCSP